MSASNVVSERPFADDATQPNALPRTRSFYWSVRREIWENRSIYVAPLAIAALALLGLVIGALRLPRSFMRVIASLDPARRAEALSIPYGFATAAIMFTAFVVAVFYCLGALHAERRDRSILFWKSLPVSDLVTVLAKAVIPLVVLPVVTLVVILATLLLILVASLALLPASGLPAAMLWSAIPPGRAALELVYTLAVCSLWYAPIWGWLLAVSGWARRAPILWAFGAPLGLAFFEKLAFGTSYVFALLRDRLGGVFLEAFAVTTDARGRASIDMHRLEPLRLIESPGLWLGLLAAAVLLAAVVWQRRWRTPL